MRTSKGHILKVAILAFVMLLTGGFIYALDDSEPQALPVPPMVRAMGGAFTGVANDENSVFYNPAGYALVDDDIISVFSLGVRANIDDSALKLWEAILTGVDLSDPTNMNNYLSNATLALGAAGPIYFGRVGNN
ncbi:MAG TPA: hypothetical protein VMZ05_00930, partial [Spirochaetota bacterium]|nr:hypothetical protein [Spirochaetota bacterium]